MSLPREFREERQTELFSGLANCTEEYEEAV